MTNFFRGKFTVTICKKKDKSTKQAQCNRLKAVKFDRVPVKIAANNFDINERTLYRYVSKINDIKLQEMIENSNEKCNFSFAKIKQVNSLLEA